MLATAALNALSASIWLHELMPTSVPAQRASRRYGVPVSRAGGSAPRRVRVTAPRPTGAASRLHRITHARRAPRFGCFSGSAATFRASTVVRHRDRRRIDEHRGNSGDRRGPGGPGLGGRAAAQRACRRWCSSAAMGSRTSWRGRYDRLRLNSSRWFSQAPGRRATRAARASSRRATRWSRYLEGYARDNALDVRLNTRVERIDPDGAGWVVRTSGGDVPAEHVIVAAGYEHTPFVPDWPGRERFHGALLHAAEYRNPEPFRDGDVLVVGPGCSGMEIAYDLAEGGAQRVRLAVRTPPNMLVRSPIGPGIALALLRVRPAPRRPHRELRPQQGDRRPDRVRAARARGGDVQPPAAAWASRRRSSTRYVDRGDQGPAHRDRRRRRVARRDRRRAGRRHADRARRRDRRDRLPPRPRAHGRAPGRARRRGRAARGRGRGGRARACASSATCTSPRSCATRAARRKRAAKAIARELHARARARDERPDGRLRHALAA